MSVVLELRLGLGALDFHGANLPLGYLKHHRATMVRLAGGDKGREVRIGQAMALQETEEPDKRGSMERHSEAVLTRAG